MNWITNVSSIQIVGSFLFGVGIVFAGGCATGTWYRAGEGLLGSWIALFGYMFMSAVMRTGFLAPIDQSLKAFRPASNSIAETTGISIWLIIPIFLAIVLVIAIKELRKPKIRIPTMKAKRSGLAHLLFEKGKNLPFIC